MKICLVSDFFYPNIGGVETHTYQLAKSLIKNGIEVHVLTNTKKDYVIDGIYVHKSYAKVLPKLNVVGSLHIWYILSYFFKKMKFDIVHGHSIYSPLALIATTIANFRKVPTVMTLHSLHPEKKGIILKAMNPLIKIALNKSKTVISVSDATKNTINDIYDLNKVKVILNAIEKDEFQSIKKSNDSNIVISSVFRMVKKKGGKYLLFAIKKVIKNHPNIRVKIIGDGRERKDLLKLACDLKISEYIEFIPKIERAKLIEILTQSDIFVLPTTTEASGIAILEAMIAECACIVTNVGGISEFANKDNSIIIDPKNSAQIADAIDQLVSDEKLRKTLAANAKKMIETSYTWDMRVKEYQNLYESVLGDAT